jgi:hypothetical protein
MTEQPYSATRSAEASQFGMQALWRVATWGGLATFALFAAVIAAYSNAGAQRQTASITAGQGTKQPRAPIADFAPQPSESAEETRRLAEAVHNLAADHDQVLTRIAALERNLDGVTGSIKRDRIAGPPQPPVQVPPQISPTPPQTPQQPAQQTPQNPAITAAIPVVRPELPAVPVAVAVINPPQLPAPQQSGAGEGAQTAAPDAGNRSVASNPVRATAPAEPLPAASGLGIDVGGATNYEGLRTLWHATKNSDPALLEDLYPVVTVRENGKTHGVDLRLVIGPIADVEAAARLCTTLAETHRYCQPVAFEGQRLTMIDTIPGKAAPTKTTSPSPPVRHSGHSSSGNSSESIGPFSNASYPHGK